MPGKTTYLVTLLCCLAILQGYAQSVRKKASPRAGTMVNVQGEIERAKNMFAAQPQAAFQLLENTLLAAVQYGNIRQQADCYLNLGEFNLALGQADLALENGNKAYSRYLRSSNQPGIYHTTLLLAKAYQQLNDYTKSLDYYRSYEQLATSKNDTSAVVYAKSQIGEVLIETGQLDDAQNNFEQVLNLETIRSNKKGQAASNRNIGRTYRGRQQNEQALNYYNVSKGIAEDIADNEELLQSGEEIASVYRGMQRYDEELDLRKELLEVDESLVSNSIRQNREIGAIYLERKQEQQAIPFLQNSIELSETTGALEEKTKATKSLSEAYRGIGSFSLALQAYRDYVSLVDSAYTIKALEIEASNELSKELLGKQQRIDLLEKDKQLTEKTIALLQQQEAIKDLNLYRQRLIIWSLAGVLVLMMVVAYLMYRNARQKRLANQLLALKSLRSQMNPHFIFNALNSVNSYIAKNNERAANKYLSDFSKLMRAVLENSKHDFVPLGSEIEVTGLYLALEHSRFAEKFQYQYVVDPDIDVSSIQIPPMLIQPYIENAVWHGLRYKQSKGFLNVHINLANEQEQSLTITIQDNGIGRAKSEALKTKNQRDGTATGMKNTKRRVQLLNDMHSIGLKVEIDDLLPHEEDTGTIVKISLAPKG